MLKNEMKEIYENNTCIYPSEECNVETGSITVDKLESKHFGDQSVVIKGLGPVVL